MLSAAVMGAFDVEAAAFTEADDAFLEREAGAAVPTGGGTGPIHTMRVCSGDRCITVCHGRASTPVGSSTERSTTKRMVSGSAKLNAPPVAAADAAVEDEAGGGEAAFLSRRLSAG